MKADASDGRLAQRDPALFVEPLICDPQQLLHGVTVTGVGRRSHRQIPRRVHRQECSVALHALSDPAGHPAAARSPCSTSSRAISSPPRRATASSARADSRRSCAVRRSSVSLARWPAVSLTSAPVPGRQRGRARRGAAPPARCAGSHPEGSSGAARRWWRAPAPPPDVCRSLRGCSSGRGARKPIASGPPVRDPALAAWTSLAAALATVP